MKEVWARTDEKKMLSAAQPIVLQQRLHVTVADSQCHKFLLNKAQLLFLTSIKLVTFQVQTGVDSEQRGIIP